MGVTDPRTASAGAMGHGPLAGADAERVVAAATDELKENGFITARLNELVTWARTGSLWPMTFGLA